MTRKFISVLGVLLALAFVACGNDAEVGDESLLDFEDRQQGRLGEATATPKATKAPSAGTAPKATPKPQATQPPQQAPTFTIAINSDAVADKFDPTPARVSKGTVIEFVNRDSEVRSVVSVKEGLFESGDIKPGESWRHTANMTGSFAYRDGTRPYARGKFEVT